MTENKSSTAIRVLVLDADLVPALTVVRSLIKLGYHVDVASARIAPIASFSKKVKQCLRYPDPLVGVEDFLSWLEQLLSREHYDLVIPVTERSLVPLSAQRHRFGETRFAMAEAASLNRVLDKAETFKLAESLGVSIPRSLYISDMDELSKVEADLTYPVVVKPSRSVSAKADAAGYSKRNVSYANNSKALRNQCEQSLRHSPVILQSYFSGVGAGIELIASHGQILYSFQHIRLHEVPLSGGGSSFRASAPIEPVLLQAAEKLIRALEWTGVAMVEFKWEPETNRYCLMEINGRLWGSLPLAVASGADFPAMLAELHITGTLGDYPAYKPDVYCRSLPSDLMWHELVLRARRGGRSQSGNQTRIPTGREVLRDLSRLFSFRHHFDTQSFRDPMPGLVEIKRLFVRYWNRLSELVSQKRFERRHGLLWRNGTVKHRMQEAQTVLFVCYGNINRSAVASVIMEELLPMDCNIQVFSAGFHQEEQRFADKRMQGVAAENGYDLSQSLSTRVTTKLVNESDIIFVMEKRHYDELLIDNPSADKKTFLLGPGCREEGRGAAEILDPYNRNEEVYKACFKQIHQAVVRLSEQVKAEHER